MWSTGFELQPPAVRKLWYTCARGSQLICSDHGTSPPRSANVA
jgi:hypothetical protein